MDEILNSKTTDNELGKKKLNDTRKPKLFLKDLNKLRKMRELQKLEKLKQNDFISVMYGDSEGTNSQPF